jgi:hypothetical protein
VNNLVGIKKKLQSSSFKCQYCDKEFVKEKTLFVHVCEQKRRALARHERHVVLAYDTYLHWYKINMGGKEPTYEDFAKSPYYNGFIKFGSFVSNVNPLYPSKFIEYVVTSGVKLDHWCRDELYDKYVIDLIKKESAEPALERSIKHMMDWADSNSSAWNHYFLYASLNRATYEIKDGKISPWLVLNCKSGKDMLRKFNDEQLASISTVMDVPFWLAKFKRLPADVAMVKEVVKEYSL